MQNATGVGHAHTGISGICTVRDGARFIRTALASALSPSIQELIVVDDGSTDETLTILAELSRAEPRLRVIPSVPVGRGQAMALALRECHGDTVVNIDADDVLHPDWIRIGRHILDTHPEVAVVAASPRYISVDENVTWASGAVHDPLVRDVTAFVAFYNPIVHSSAMLRRSALNAVGGYDGARRTHVDYDLWIRLAGAGWRLAVAQAPLVAKRLHQGQHFERGHRLSYLWASALVQVQGIRAVHGGMSAWASLAARLVWGLLPRFVRMFVRRLIGDRL